MGEAIKPIAPATLTSGKLRWVCLSTRSRHRDASCPQCANLEREHVCCWVLLLAIAQPGPARMKEFLDNQRP